MSTFEVMEAVMQAGTVKAHWVNINGQFTEVSYNPPKSLGMGTLVLSERESSADALALSESLHQMYQGKKP